MKKTILVTIAIALATILPAKISAEDAKEYNMVITLQNGTTITLGHNDIKNITFNGEEISIEGNAVNSIEENKMRIEELNQMLQNLHAYMEDRLNQERELTEVQITDVRNEMAGHIDALLGRLYDTEEQLTAVVNMQEVNIDEIRGQIDGLRANLDEIFYALRAELQYESDNLRTIVAELETRIAALENQK